MRSFDEGIEILVETADESDPSRNYLPPLSGIDFLLYNPFEITTLRLLLSLGIKINVPNEYFTNTLTYYIVQCKRRIDDLNKDICMLLFAAGERVPGPVVEARTDYFSAVVKAQVPEYLFHKELQMCLKHLCREAIRNHLLDLDPHTHLFGRVPRIGLPKSLAEYVLYNVHL